MRPAGDERLAHWREVGEWWANRPQREVLRYVDEHGIRREEVVQLAPVGRKLFEEKADPRPYIEDHREEVSLRVRRVRDEKVARACGYVPFADYSFLASSEKKGYALLHTLSGYSFGESAINASDIPLQAANRGIEAALLADSFSLAGAIEFTKTARQVGVKPLIGATFEMAEGGAIVLVAQTKRGYQHLSHLITECHLEEPRLHPLCTWERLERHANGLLCLTGGSLGLIARRLIDRHDEEAEQILRRLVELFGRQRVFVQIERSFLPWDLSVNHRLLQLAERLDLVPVAGGPITHATRDEFPAQDIVTCIETLCTIEEVIGRKPPRHELQPQIVNPPARALNAERFIHSPAEMAALYGDRPDLIENTKRLADFCEDDVFPSRTNLPELGMDEATMLREATYEGARSRVKKLDCLFFRRIETELDRIIKNAFAGHFLIAHDMCEWARGQGILFSGRGSVVDSAVAYCLGLSRINAHEHDLHFDRFLPESAGKRPDIDIDFEAHRRDDVRGYLVKKYGERHVATVGAVGTYCTRGIVREVGKVMGIPNDLLTFLTKRLHGSVSPESLEKAIEMKPELRESGIPRESFQWVFKLAELLMDLPRNLRSHSSGVVISRDPIADTVPMTYSGVEDVKIIQWDKRSAKGFFDKFDVLCLRGQDVLSGTQQRLRRNDPSFDVEDISLEDEETYRTMRSGNLIGIPQSASPAMRQAHIRLRTENLKDASLVQAGIRPGVGGAVKINELIARRRGKPYSFAHPELENILKKTYGIIVFQEQVDQLLQTFGGYTSDEAEDVRESIHKRRKEGFADSIKEVVRCRVVENGFSETVANEVFDLVSGFQGYGFAEGHALAFAEVSIRSIWCQQNYPAEYFAALLDAQPAGYYGPCTLANEARIRNVRMLPPDVNLSGLKFLVEDVLSEEDPKLVFPNGGIRTSLSQIGGVSKDLLERIVAARALSDEIPPLEGRLGGVSNHLQRGRKKSPSLPLPQGRGKVRGDFTSFADLVARIRPNRDELERLILCGAFDSLQPNRRMLLWGIPKAYQYADTVNAQDDVLPLDYREPPLKEVPDFDEVEKAIHERAILGMDVERHLMHFERAKVQAKGGISSQEASNMEPGTKAFVVGNPIRLRFPPTVSGRRVMFFDLEDETGLLNVTCFDDVYQRDGHVVICSPYVTLRGEAQDRDGHIAFLAHRIFPYEPSLTGKKLRHEPLPIVTADFLAR